MIIYNYIVITNLLNKSVTKPQQNENEYAKFIKDRGGSLLADTGYERTKYIFQIHPDHLQPAMDRFANLFINPSLRKETILRERESVDNEFHVDSASDYDRLRQLFRILPKDNHPASKFASGNLVTLRDNVSGEELYSELITFKRRHYSANRMTLAVQATLSLDTLEKYVKDCFSRLPMNHLSPYDFSKFTGFNSFNPLKFRKLYTVKSVTNCQEIELKWILPPSNHLYRSKPIHYICHLMNLEARGSLSHYFREKKMCDRLSVNHEQNSLFTVLTVNLVLPHRDQNGPCTKKILEAVFSYVNMMRRVPQDLRRRIFEELRSIAECKFEFADEINAASNVQSLCRNMQSYPATDYLTGNELYFEFDDREIQTFLDNLTPNNVFILVLGNKTLSDDELNEMEPWYKIRYLSEKMTDDWIGRLEKIEPFPEFFLPAGPNPFFVTDPRMIDQPVQLTESPVKIETDKENAEIWYKANLTFGLPQSYAYVRLATQRHVNSVQTCVMLRLLEILLHELLLEDLFNAKIAGLAFNVAANSDGILIKANGFSQKVPRLLNILVKFIADFVILVKKDVFDLVKSELLTYYSSVLYDPGSLATEISLSILESSYSWTSSEKHAALIGIKFNQFIDFARNLTNPFKAQCLVQGNVSKKDAIAIIKEAVEPLRFCSLFTNESRNLTNNSYRRLQIDRKFCKVKNFNVSDVSSVVMNHYNTNASYSSVLDLPIFKEFLQMLLQEPLFHQLRTTEQLGYSLSSFTTPTGFNITIYSPSFKFTTEHIDERIDLFVRSFFGLLKQMSKNEFDARIEDFVKMKMCEDVNLRDEVERNWFAITTGSPIFDQRRELILMIKSLTIREFHRWINNILMNVGNFKELSVQVVGNA
ncbi:nardilysin-like isoform X3 [Nasonia vitripennis]|uniref:Uncharacterized protein n=1 Tax=Nasonia vitripennis TaxID=7425 RepID=A0A7M7QFM2_NASVI|nr:nardilysin-like isoform X3 [Nasonia vitripennis]